MLKRCVFFLVTFTLKSFYNINYGIIQGFPALRKSVTTHVKKCDIFPRVFDIGNQLLSRHSLSLMNERQSLHHSQSKVVCRNLFGLWLLKHWKIRIAFRKWRSNFFLVGKQTKIRKEKPKVTYSVALVIAVRLITKIDKWKICHRPQILAVNLKDLFYQ